MSKRVLLGVTFALLMGFLTFAITQAQTVPEVYGSDDCGNCHEAVTSQWQNSAHGHASVVATFLDAWAEQGSPPECLRCHTTGFNAETGSYEKEGIACETCHPSDPAEHPQTIMQTDISSRLCGQCHVDTFSEWEASQHGQEGLTCARCHNPHTNELRAGSMQDTCRSCHKEETHFYTFTAHASEGLLCTDCHLQTNNTPLGSGHSQINHTFSVGSDACTACHSDGLHKPTAPTTTVDSKSPCLYDQNASVMQASFPTLNSTETDSILPELSANSTYNFTILAALIGLAFGLVGSPWLEKWQERLRAQDQGGSNEQ